MIRLHFLFGDDIWYDGPPEENSMKALVRSHLQLEEDRYVIRFLHDEQDPLVRYVLVEDLAITDPPFDVDSLPCYVTAERPRCTIWIDPPDDVMPFYTEYYQFYLNDGLHRNSRYWKPFEGIELHCRTALAEARYHYLAHLYRDPKTEQTEQTEQEQKQEEWEQEEQEEWEEQQKARRKD